jgi:hypothetical protein
MIQCRDCRVTRSERVPDYQEGFRAMREREVAAARKRRGETAEGRQP